MTRHEAFAKARKEKGLSRREAAAQAGIPYNSATKAEIGLYPTALERLIRFFEPVWGIELPAEDSALQRVTPAAKFKLARLQNRIARQEIQESLSLSYSQVHQAESGRNDTALQRMIQHFGPVWAIPEDWFFDGCLNDVPKGTPLEALYGPTKSPSLISPSHGGTHLNVLFWKTHFDKDAGSCWFSPKDAAFGPVPALFLDDDPDRFFVVQVEGANLGRLAGSGDLLLVKKAPAVTRDALSIVEVGSGRAECRIVRAIESGPFVVCDPATGEISPHGSSEWKLLGEVVAIFLKSVGPPLPNLVWDLHRPITVPVDYHKSHSG